jgi:hypothetical protein
VPVLLAKYAQAELLVGRQVQRRQARPGHSATMNLAHAARRRLAGEDRIKEMPRSRAGITFGRNESATSRHSMTTTADVVEVPFSIALW